MQTTATSPTMTRANFSPAVPLVLCVLALLAGFALGAVVRGPNVLGWDVNIAVAVQGTDGALVEGLADLGNAIGSTVWAAGAIGLAIVLAAVARAWPDVAFLVTLLALRLIATQTKAVFDSPRPTDDLVTIIGTWDGMGYPSGHALTASTMMLGLAVIAWRRIPSRPLAIGTIGILIGLMLLVGWARIWTGAHWPSDVVGGYLFGIAIVAVSVLVLERVARR